VYSFGHLFYFDPLFSFDKDSKRRSFLHMGAADMFLPRSVQSPHSDKCGLHCLYVASEFVSRGYDPWLTRHILQKAYDPSNSLLENDFLVQIFGGLNGIGSFFKGLKETSVQLIMRRFVAV
jgi:hypothetical protein